MPTEDTSGIALSNQELESILRRQFGSDIHVDRYTYVSATQPGENYGSTMLSLVISVRRTDGQTQETLRVVAKLAPPTEFLQKMFNMRVTFCKEMNMYKLVKPALDQLQRENGFPQDDLLNVFPKYCGARTSLSGDEDPTADTSAILLLENLSVSGYKLVDRLHGLDFQHCELALSQLAQFHALPIALRQKNPRLYKDTVLKATMPFSPENLSLTDRHKLLQSHLDALKKSVPEIVPYMSKIKERCIQNLSDDFQSTTKEPFFTIVHNDLWTNNMMFTYSKVDGQEIPIGVKFVDFQITLHCSPVKDLIFFLFSSIDAAVRDKYYDHFIECYYANFIETLQKLKCDISEFTFDKFLEEIRTYAPTQFYHILFMINVIYTEKKNVKNLSEIHAFDELQVGKGDLCCKKLLEHVKIFDKNGWI